MTPKGADLEVTDLIEVSTIVGGSYVTKSITGQELIDAIPLPPTGLTVGTTPISSGTIGRVLFQGTGNVLQQSSSLFWDNTNGFLGIGTSTPSTKLHVVGSEITFAVASGTMNFYNTPGANSHFNFINSRQDSDYIFKQNRNGVANSTSLVLKGLTGNVLINTTTDAGFRLDVNGNTRINGDITAIRVVSSILRDGNNNAYINNSLINIATTNLAIGGTTVGEFTFTTKTSGGKYVFNNANVLINTTTDAGFKLDVNGTARVKGTGTTIGTTSFTVQDSASSDLFRVYDNGLVAIKAGVISLNGSNGSITGGFIASTGQMISGGTSITPSAQMEVISTTRGFLPPRMTTTQRNAIASPAAGLVVYDNTDNKHYGYNGTTWNAFY